MALKIEGTVQYEGNLYEWSGDFRPPRKGEIWLASDGQPVTALSDYDTCDTRFILREVKPPHVYKVGDWVRVKEDKASGAPVKAGDQFKVTKVCKGCVDTTKWLFDFNDIEPCDPPAPKYRPFANAEEFKPHRDRWWSYKSNEKTVWPPAPYSETYWAGRSWQEAFDERVFDDGSPCGVLITE